MPRIVALSDTHMRHSKIVVPDGDILIHAGDATIRGDEDEVTRFAAWFGALPHPYKLLVAGNHDWLFQKKPLLARKILDAAGIIYLEDAGVAIRGLKFYGSPWTPEFGGWAFMKKRGPEMRAVWNRIDPEVEILATHGPPHGIGDQVPSGHRIGCEDLRKRIDELSKLKLHIFGHCHHGYGVSLNGKYVNAAICDEAYRPVNAPVVLDI